MSLDSPRVSSLCDALMAAAPQRRSVEWAAALVEPQLAEHRIIECSAELGARASCDDWSAAAARKPLTRPPRDRIHATCDVDVNERARDVGQWAATGAAA